MDEQSQIEIIVDLKQEIRDAEEYIQQLELKLDRFRYVLEDGDTTSYR
jgi:hypothetical protein